MKIDWKKISRRRLELTLLLALLLVIGGLYLSQDGKQLSRTTTETKPGYQVPARPRDIDEGSRTMLSAMKLARVAAHRYEREQADRGLKDAISVWRDTVNEFINTPPTGYNTETWARILSGIFEDIQAAEKALAANDYEKAKTKIDHARAELDKVYDTSKNDLVENKLFPLLVPIDDLLATRDIGNAKKKLAAIKIAYTELKEVPETAAQAELMSRFEKALSELDNADQKTLKESLDRIDQDFYDLYANL